MANEGDACIRHLRDDVGRAIARAVVDADDRTVTLWNRANDFGDVGRDLEARNDDGNRAERDR